MLILYCCSIDRKFCFPKFLGYKLDPLCHYDKMNITNKLQININVNFSYSSLLSCNPSIVDTNVIIDDTKAIAIRLFNFYLA